MDTCNLFGCSGGERPYRFDDELTDHLMNPRVRDRLEHMDGLNRDRLEQAWAKHRVSRRSWLKGALTIAVASMFDGLARRVYGQATLEDEGNSCEFENEVTIPSIAGETVRQGQFRMDVPDIVTVESGTMIHCPNTFTHFLNRLQPGITMEDFRTDFEAAFKAGIAPHSVIGPIGVRGAELDDMLEIEFCELDPIGFGINIVPPIVPISETTKVRLGALPEEFPEGLITTVAFDHNKKGIEFLPGVRIPFGPFQGIFGVAPPPTAGDAVNSIPPGQFGGNLDLRELTAGSKLYLPVWRDGARIFTGDSHAAQGDGEVCLTAIETAMQDLRFKVILHKGALADVSQEARWPIAETATHWITMGISGPYPEGITPIVSDPSDPGGPNLLSTAFRRALIRALRNAIDFLVNRAGFPTRAHAYAFCSFAVSFRITQAVNRTIGVHAMIPKDVFDESLLHEIRVA
jgi:acetamidase/formamidase